MPRFAVDIEFVPRPARSQEFLDALNHRVVIADGAMGTMLQGRDLSLEDDFQGLEGCNEILNDTGPDVLADIHDAYFATGIDAVETNTFGANWSNLSAVNGCKQAIVTRGIRLPIFVEVTVETTGTMLVGSEIGAALTALEPLGAALTALEPLGAALTAIGLNSPPARTI